MWARHAALQLAALEAARAAAQVAADEAAAAAAAQVAATADVASKTAQLALAGSRGSAHNSALLGVAARASAQEDSRAARSLTVQIKAIHSLSDLDALVTSRTDLLNQINVSTAMSMVGKLPGAFLYDQPVPTPAAAKLMERLADLLMLPQHLGQAARIERLDEYGLTHTLWALVDCHAEGSRAFGWLVERLQDRDVLERCNQQDLSSMATAVVNALLRGESGQHGTHQLLAAIAESLLTGRQRPYDPQGVANLMWAFAKVGSLDRSLAQFCCRTVSNMRLADFGPQDLAHILWSLATAGHVDVPVIVMLCQEVEQSQLRGWAEQHIANTVWALGVLSSVSSRAAWAPAHPTVQRLLPMLAWRAKAQVEDFVHIGMNQLLTGLAHLDYKHGAALLDAVAHRALTGGMTGAAVESWVKLLEGFATLRHSAPQLYQGAVRLMEPLLPSMTRTQRHALVRAYKDNAPPSSLADLLAAIESSEGQ